VKFDTKAELIDKWDDIQAKLVPFLQGEPSSFFELLIASRSK
jgi:hypothetical protein